MVASIVPILAAVAGIGTRKCGAAVILRRGESEIPQEKRIAFAARGCEKKARFYEKETSHGRTA
ncbi:hypothetical protein N4R57_05600 [Rhodobacteraceae bacterium D3-12]|nr:hypothetical protein N4R57_05600 [Rhodobacteraceae bacterium D3-12]